MARWNEDMSAAPSDRPVIFLTWGYRRPTQPIVGQATLRNGKWWWASGRPVLHWDGGDCCEPTGWAELPRATQRQRNERKWLS